ncbi:MAG: GWxTD domain-containing protein [Bacteroidales bacterium]|nr:GWxTD domain-containing protein [Candidatus Latescibacterota bacterium]
MKTVFSLFMIFLLMLCACTPYRDIPVDKDFLNPLSGLDTLNIKNSINDVKESLRFRPEDPSLHRKLAIYYRLMATPYSRAISIEEIDRAIALDPDDPLNHVERGLTLYAMRFIGDAEAAMKQAIKLDPGFFHAWFQLGRIEKDRYLVNMCFTERKENAISYFKKAYNIDDTHEETLYNLGLLHCLRRMYKTSKKYASRASTLHPDNPKHHLLLGTILFRMGLFEDAAKEYDTALILMDDLENSYYLDTAPLLPFKQREEYLKWPETQGRKWSGRFWLRNDPTPATELNERLLEHYERVFLARELLTHDRLGLDGAETARGLALISYGLPDKFLYNLGGGLHGSMVAWEYCGEGTGFTLYFQDEFLNGNYHIPIDPAFISIATATQNILNSVPQSYEYPVAFIPAGIHVASARRMLASGNTDLEFSIAIPDSAIDDPGTDFTLVLSIFDFDLNRIIYEIHRIRPDTLLSFKRGEESYRLFNFNIGMIPPSGKCDMAIELTGGKPYRRATCEREIEIGDLSWDKPGASDIRFTLSLSEVGCTSLLDPIPAYDHGTRLCLSYDIYNLSRGQDNLSRYRLTYAIKTVSKSAEDYSGIRKTLWWIARSARGGSDDVSPFISSSLEQSIDSPHVTDALQIELGSIEPGRYVLTLDIEDIVSGGTIRREREFVIKD